jgi:lycopene cyclase domain-containing protein
MSLYLYINLAIIMFPLLLSFEKRIKYYSKAKALLPAIIIVSIIFIVWDVFATFRGHWSFNPDHILGVKLAGLPLEEILFFITVPYSCIFAYEGISYFLKDNKINLEKWVFYVIGGGFLLLAVLFINKEYTFLALLSVGLTLIFAPRIFTII